MFPPLGSLLALSQQTPPSLLPQAMQPHLLHACFCEGCRNPSHAPCGPDCGLPLRGHPALWALGFCCRQGGTVCCNSLSLQCWGRKDGPSWADIWGFVLLGS